MKFTQILTLLCILTTTATFAKASNSNKIVDGKRVGYWYLNNLNESVDKNSAEKVSEGKYINGRKEGVWIYYYEKSSCPRLIGEYSDNRPSGTYFRFTRQGKMTSASANSRILKKSNRVGVSNSVYTCQLNFENQDLVAGQVYFNSKLFAKNCFKFWVSKNFEHSNVSANKIDFTWLHNSYNSIYAAYLDVRTPPSKRVSNEVVSAAAQMTSGNTYLTPPVIKNPKVAEGLEFKPNGMNKLFSKNDEIWMDGYFENGQLRDGKVFLYDSDGVLLKVRIYKKGKYLSDGGL